MTHEDDTKIPLGKDQTGKTESGDSDSLDKLCDSFSQNLDLVTVYSKTNCSSAIASTTTTHDCPQPSKEVVLKTDKDSKAAGIRKEQQRNAELQEMKQREQEKRDKDIVGNRRRKADKLAKKYLSSAKKALGSKDDFYIALERAFHNYLKSKLNIETSEFNKEKITILLTERQVSQQTVLEFISILENCELARYTPITQVTMENDYKKSVKIISQIDKQIK